MPTWEWLGEYMTMDKTFCNLLFQQDIVNTPRYFQMFFLITFLDKAFIKNIIIILCINHTIIICINDNNSVINNIYGRYEDHILFFQIPMGMWTDFFRICRKFGHVPLERFASLQQCIFHYHLLTEICLLVSQVLQQQSSAVSNIILDSVFHFLCLDCMSPCLFCCHKPLCPSFPAAVTNAHKVLSIWNMATVNASWSIWHATIQWQQAWPNMMCSNCIHECVFAKNI